MGNGLLSQSRQSSPRATREPRRDRGETDRAVSGERFLRQPDPEKIRRMEGRPVVEIVGMPMDLGGNRRGVHARYSQP